MFLSGFGIESAISGRLECLAKVRFGSLADQLVTPFRHPRIAHGGSRETFGFASEPTRARLRPGAYAPRPRRPKRVAFGIAVSEIPALSAATRHFLSQHICLLIHRVNLCL